MLISHSHRFIALKTFKTAGTSLEIYFEKYCVDPATYGGATHQTDELVSSYGIVGYRGANGNSKAWWNHMPAQAVRSRIDEKTWGSYYKFCAIRNPFDKLVSWWWFTLDRRVATELANGPFSAVRQAFNNFIAASPQLNMDRTIFTVEGQVCVDKFIRYERLHEDIASVCSAIGEEFEPARLGKYKSEFRLRTEAFSLYYDEVSHAMVSNAYQLEVELFGYSLAE